MAVPIVYSECTLSRDHQHQAHPALSQPSKPGGSQRPLLPSPGKTSFQHLPPPKADLLFSPTSATWVTGQRAVMKLLPHCHLRSQLQRLLLSCCLSRQGINCHPCKPSVSRNPAWFCSGAWASQQQMPPGKSGLGPATQWESRTLPRGELCAAQEVDALCVSCVGSDPTVEAHSQCTSMWSWLTGPDLCW